MSATRDRVMAKYPGVIVIDITAAGEHPMVQNAPAFIVFDDRLPDDPEAAGTITFRIQAKIGSPGIGGPHQGNRNGDTLVEWWFSRDQAQMDLLYP